MKNIKFIILTTVFIFSGFFMQKTQAQFHAGLGLSYGSEIEELGLNLRVGYQITEAINANANYTFWLLDIDGLSFSTFNLDGHYSFLEKEKLSAYGLAGLNISRSKIEDIDLGPFGKIEGGSDSEVGLNLGGGVDFEIMNALGIFSEVKYIVGEADQLIITGGLKYSF